MTSFDLDILNSIRGPSPEPEAPVSGVAPKEGSARGSPVPESESDNTRITQAWVMVLVKVDASKMTRPDLKQELLQDIETWLHEWDANICACHHDANEAGMLLALSDEEKAVLTNIKKWALVARKMVGDWKKAAERLMVEVSMVCAGHEKGKGKKKEVDAGEDMGRPKLGSKISCMEGCTSRCAPCDKSHVACSFAAKRKAAGTVGPACKAARVAGGSMAIGLTSADDADHTGESEVEVEVVEVPPPAPEQSACLLAPLPIRAVAKVACLTKENASLRALKEEYARFVLNTCRQARAQQIEFTVMSNKLYAWGDEWRDMGKEMKDFVAEQECSKK
ncbi:uncharacterized protein EDB93DRAFT_1253023 [Suillus bovinus]|uniref:uncharacterized protein n=1 Tax=Suillus bovinus TaxID=48563 RepID=UPI001B85EEB9|nr:uncharacterized protein EDB93DRAFT_1253023 [Suillus bovinus]KAG2139611.1 hypothetical protein EDB93DRAFT_1253023 [Suillus bovinus]